jgi:hypothetical protein
VRFDRLVAAAATGAGWTFTQSGVEWTVGLAVVLGGWIAIRVTIDLAESRGGLAAMLVGLGCYLAVVVDMCIGGNMTCPTWVDVIASTAPLTGHVFLFAAFLLYARYVVLDVQGLIDHQPARFAAIRAASNAGESVDAAPRLAESTTSDIDAGWDAQPSLSTNESREATSGQVRWVDGSQGDVRIDEGDDDSPSRKLSNSQRKKFRKQKSRRYAA